MLLWNVWGLWGLVLTLHIMRVSCKNIWKLGFACLAFLHIENIGNYQESDILNKKQLAFKSLILIAFNWDKGKY